MQRKTLENELSVARGLLSLIDQLLYEAAALKIKISEQTIPVTTIVSLCEEIPTYADEGILWSKLDPIPGASRNTPIGTCGVIERRDKYIEKDVDI